MEREVALAADLVAQRFPFPRYFTQMRAGCERTAQTLLNWVPRGGTILDFGAGPADKTGVLAALGYHCVAVDDLSDEWHQRDGNRERILRFAADIGIDYRRPPEGLDFEPESLDAVLLHDVLEHLHDSPRALLVKLLEAVKTGGHLLIVVPNAANIRKRLALLRGRTNYQPYEWYFWFPTWRQHVREYVRGDLEKLVAYLGLEVVELGGVHRLVDHRPMPRLVSALYRAATRVIPGWRDSLLLVARKPPSWRPPERDLDDLYEEIVPSSLLSPAGH